jgi:hypothetical protein
MKALLSRRHVLAAAGAFLAVLLVAAGVWLYIERADRNNTATAPTSPEVTTPATSTPGPSPATMTVKVYFHKGPGADPTKLFAVKRTVPRGPQVATAALTELLAGPTSAERDAGYWSMFSERTADRLRSVRIGNGVGYADFRDFSRIIPNASSSTGSAVLLSELDATLKQFGTVRTTVYSFDGTVAPFYEWLQLSAPVGERPSLAQARVVARDFLIRIVGMRTPGHVASRYVSDALVAVDFRPMTAGQLRGPVTTVLLGYGVTGFTAIWATTDTIAVDTPSRALDPADATPVSSPLTVSGRALAREGTVELGVVQDNGIALRKLGGGYGTAGGDEVRPFDAVLTFSRPSTSTGWLLATEASARDGDVVKATAVPLTFAGAPVRPAVLRMSYATAPARPEFEPDDPLAGIPVNGWAWPTGRGTITLTVSTSTGTERVQLFTTPLGSGATRRPALLGTATRSGAEFRYVWRYADTPLLAEITVVVTGPGGRGDRLAFNVFHS